MANQAIIAKKEEIVNEIEQRVKNANSAILFDYRGLSDSEITELRCKLRENGSSYKVYKNTLTKRAFDRLSINLDDCLEGPSAIATSDDEIAPIKILSDFAKDHPEYDGVIILTDGCSAHPIKHKHTKSRFLWVCPSEKGWNNHHEWMDKTGKSCFLKI